MRGNKVLVSVLVLAASAAVESAFLFGTVSSLRSGVDALVSEVSDRVNLSDLAASLESGGDVRQVLQNMSASSEPDAASGSSEFFSSENSAETTTDTAPDVANIVSDGKEYKTEQNLIDGCQSRVWLQADMEDGKVVFQAESDALIVKGIIALLIKVVSGHTPDEILSSDLYFIEKIGLKEHLSPTRSNGLLAMVKQMRMYALAFKAKMAN